MKKVVASFVLILIMFFSQAQFTKASLQASGLTCSMCNNAIYKALKILPFVSLVKPDIKNAEFDLVFKTTPIADIDAIKKTVEGAGFSLAKLQVTGNFDSLVIKNDVHIKIHGQMFHFLNAKDQLLNGEHTLTLVDKGFLTGKEFKKMTKTTSMSCIQKGKTNACSTKEDVAENARIYHVII